MWVGIDPGGADKFGVAFLSDNGSVEMHLLSCADEALSLIENEPKGVGIDVPLWWSSGPSGDRQVDQWIRDEYKIRSGTVQTANSLRGAILVQGAMFASGLRQRYPKVPITEAHPKALLLALGIAKWSQFADKFAVCADVQSEHERDALIAAVCGREGFSGKWNNDLALLERHACEQDPKRHWLAPVHYFWPH